jgi:hypothetical protein
MDRGGNSTKSERKSVLDIPIVRAAIPTVTSLLSNVLAGTYVFEITKTIDGHTKLLVSDSFKSYSFWMMCLVAIFVVWYSIKSYQVEKSYEEFKSTSNVRAMIMRDSYPVFLAKIIEDVRADRLKSFSEAMRQLGIDE